ncbi:MAG: hypothetical protein HDR23_05330 [Lachnospiraceae bacterium]|nr:hypothetical protein [Lachnospiraceae bacterium]
MKKAIKGTFGYLKCKRNMVLIRTMIYFAISLALLFAGIITTGSKKNLLTIVAVLGCLPACKSLVNLIMYFKASGCSEMAKTKIEKEEGSLVGMYDMYFTSYKKNFAISHMVVEGKNICGFTESDTCDTKACEEHLNTMLKQGGHKDMTVKIFTDINKYCERLKQLNALGCSTPQKDDEVRVVLYDISL